MKHVHTVIFFLGMLTLLCGSANAQFFDESQQVKYDTNYIKVYKDELTTRFYVSRKQNGLSVSEKLLQPGLKYKTNDNLLLGLGYTYSFLTINLGVKMPFINKDDEVYGESKYLNLSLQTLFRKYLFDFYFQWTRGYYISNSEELSPISARGIAYPLRGDLRTNLVGFSFSYLFNSERFSYKASFQQNEFQKRSAGTPMAGAEAYWMLTMADSSIVPGPMAGINSLDETPFNQADLYNFGLNGGYAYTFVWDEHLYFSLASTLGISGAYQLIRDSRASYTCCDGLTAGLSNTTKIALGYNNNKYYVGVSYVRFAMSQFVAGQGDWITYSAGHIRVSLVKRFRLKRTIKILRPDTWIF